MKTAGRLGPPVLQATISSPQGPAPRCPVSSSPWPSGAAAGATFALARQRCEQPRADVVRGAAQPGLGEPLRAWVISPTARPFASGGALGNISRVRRRDHGLECHCIAPRSGPSRRHVEAKALTDIARLVPQIESKRVFASRARVGSRRAWDRMAWKCDGVILVEWRIFRANGCNICIVPV